ncbi:MAG TPA: ion transporter [Burkholderiaceae bacterium]|nr:ion transporter [Burkholderiaceae bacterium]
MSSDSPLLTPGESAPLSSAARRYGIPASGRRRDFFIVIFESDTRAGRLFDIVLLWAILASVTVVMLDSVASISSRFGLLFDVLEWGFTLLFTAEYLARLWSVERPLLYARSFFGVVDLVSVLPTYLALFVPGMHVLIDIRLLRMLRVFRILKLTEYVQEYRRLGSALSASRRKIAVFIGTVFMLVVLIGTLMYLIEGPENGFTSIPIAVYWAITTVTTVGFGDITPHTDLGRALASVSMLLGWGILAVPTGIVTAEMTSQRIRESGLLRRCGGCGSTDHTEHARYCQGCGARLEGRTPEAASR